MKRKKLQRRKSPKKSEPEFTSKTRVYDLVKREFHEELKLLIENIKPYVRDSDSIDWKHLKCLYFDKKKTKKTVFVLIIARFLLAIGKGNGLKCKMSVFIRYLASNEHSNFCLKPRSLNTLIYRMFEYLEGLEKQAENL